MRIGMRSLFTAFALFATTSVLAAEIKPFDQATFDALQAAGKPVLIDVYADWCPICKHQGLIVSELMASPEFKDYTVLKVNFDTQKDVRRNFGVSEQSTFIVYRGRRELARSTADRSKDSIAATLRKALS